MASGIVELESGGGQRPPVDPSLAASVGDVNRPRRAPPPGPSLDHLPGESGLARGMANVADYMRRGVGHVSDKRRTFGPVFRTALGPNPSVWVCDAELGALIARNGDQAWSSALGWTAIFEKIDSSSETLDMLGTLDAEPHRDARKLLQPAFSSAAMASYIGAASPIIEAAVDGWVARGRVAFKPEVRRVLAAASSRIFLGDMAGGAMLDRALADAWLAPLALVKNRWVSPAWRRALRGYRVLLRELRARIPASRARGGEDLFSRLCCASPDVDWLDDDRLVRLFIGVLFGAFDTTGAGLASMAYLLARHPAWQERLRQEAFAVGASRVAYDDLRRLEATDRAWKETLRLLPVVGGLPRYALRDVEVGGHRIPAGTLVMAMIGSAQRDASWWTDPERFDPDRFSDARAEDKIKPGVFMPFGAGAHACIGSQLATAEVKAFWHAMLTRCRLRLAHDYEARHTYTPMGMVSGDVEIAVDRV
jgi:cytochrome P450